MTNKEILKKAIEKVYCNAEIRIIDTYDILRVDMYTIGSDFPFISLPYQCIIFSHEFAKVFWGKEKLCDICGLPEGHPKQCFEWTAYILAWQYHLQQMVLWEDPIKYLEKFL